MRAGSAFLIGVIGAAVMVGLIAIARAMGITNFDAAMTWGAWVTGNVSGGAWILGFVIQLIIGGLVGLIYAAVFEAIRASNWGLGLAGGVVHAIIAGLIVAAIPAITTAAGVVPAPGAFTAYYGTGSIVTFIIAHLVYGIIMGGSYRPVHALPPATPREVREEEPVGAGRDEHHLP